MFQIKINNRVVKRLNQSSVDARFRIGFRVPTYVRAFNFIHVPVRVWVRGLNVILVRSFERSHVKVRVVRLTLVGTPYWKKNYFQIQYLLGWVDCKNNVLISYELERITFVEYVSFEILHCNFDEQPFSYPPNPKWTL